MSHVAGLDVVQRKLSNLSRAAQSRIDQAVERGANEFRSDLVSRAPRRTGRLVQALQSSDALKIRKRDGAIEASVGFNTRAQKKAAFYGFFQEFGTKGYAAGSVRSAGVDKRGRKRQQRIKRFVPARPAQPFFRPAIVTMRANMARLRSEAWAKALGDMMLGG